jgi:GrpB-like predicted nucleotidyltransferase (UPF0157 family)
LVKLVHLEAYNPQWKELYERDKVLIGPCFKGSMMKIEHVGSTSIPGMCAKPLIDIAVAVESFRVINDETILALREIGYEYVHKEEFPNRRFFRRGEWGAGTHHLHVYIHNSREWKDILLFRDYLKGDSNVMAQYINLKQELASQHERIAYTNLKAPFIQRILTLAREVEGI